MTHRTFLALDIDEACRGRLAKLRDRLAPAAAGKVNWVVPANLHVTLKFLGDCDAGTLSNVCDAVTAAADERDAFDFDVTGTTAIPHRGPLRMLWAEARDESGGMVDLFNRLEANLAPLGFGREKRAFRGHVTLARIKFLKRPDELRRAVADLADEPFGLVAAERVTVYTSELTPKGPIYTPAAHAPLR
jgi:2'-5' RNA ligase